MPFLPTSDPIAWVVLVIGALVGLFYAFDGWKASVKDAEFSKTSRLTSLKYAVVGFGSTYIVTDVKPFQATTPKAQLLFFYIEGFVVVAVLGVIAWTLIVKCASLKVWKSPEARFIPANYNPTLDYLYYGYSYYASHAAQVQAAATKDRNDHSRKFRRAYLEQLTLVMAAVGKPHPFSPDDKRRAKIAILQTIVGVVRQYYVDGSDLTVNANCMAVYKDINLPRELRTQIRFARTGITYPFYLAIEEYALPVGKESFILPVEDTAVSGWQEKVLLGAPEAFAKGELVIVNDTWKLPKEASSEIREYFRTKTFRSFASLSVIHDGQAVGVVNVESNKKYVFGEEEESQKRYLLFCNLLRCY